MDFGTVTCYVSDRIRSSPCHQGHKPGALANWAISPNQGLSWRIRLRRKPPHFLLCKPTRSQLQTSPRDTQYSISAQEPVDESLECKLPNQNVGNSHSSQSNDLQNWFLLLSNLVVGIIMMGQILVISVSGSCNWVRNRVMMLVAYSPSLAAL